MWEHWPDAHGTFVARPNALQREGSPTRRLAIGATSEQIPAPAYRTAQCLINHITQLAAIVPPTNSTKQNAPNRIIIRGSDLCVIPNTTEVNNENSRTALK